MATGSEARLTRAGAKLQRATECQAGPKSRQSDGTPAAKKMKTSAASDPATEPVKPVAAAKKATGGKKKPAKKPKGKALPKLKLKEQYYVDGVLVLQAAPALDQDFGTEDHGLDTGQNYKVARILEVPKVKDCTLGKPVFEWLDVAEITQRQVPFLSINELRALNASRATCDAQTANDRLYHEELLEKMRLRYNFFLEDIKKSYFKNSEGVRCRSQSCKDRACDHMRVPRHWSEIVPRTSTQSRSTAVHSGPNPGYGGSL